VPEVPLIEYKTSVITVAISKGARSDSDGTSSFVTEADECIHDMNDIVGRMSVDKRCIISYGRIDFREDCPGSPEIVSRLIDVMMDNVSRRA
jgi:hypothetical protein